MQTLERVELAALSLDKAGNVIFINNYLLNLLGYKRKEVIGKHWVRNFLPGNIREVMHEKFDRHIINKEVLEPAYINPIRTKKGDLCLVKWNDTISCDSKGEPNGIITIGEDITNRITHEKKLTETNKIPQLLYNSTKELAGTLDENKIYEILHKFVRTAMPCDGFYISSFDDKTGTIKCEAAWGEGKWLKPEKFPLIPLEEQGKGTQSRVIRSGKSMIMNNYCKYRDTAKTKYYVDLNSNILDTLPDNKPKTSSAIIVPIKVENKVIRVVMVSSYLVNSYDKGHLELLETMATHIAAALVNADLFKKAQVEIAERKKVEETLQLTQFSIDKAADAITWVDMNGKFTKVNESACKLFSTPKNEFLKMHVWDYDINATEKSWFKFKNCLKEKESDLSETEIRINVKIIPVEILANYIIFKGKEYIVAFVRDVTDRRNSVEMLKSSEERYRAFFEQNSVGVTMVSLDELKFLSVNNAYCNMLGYTREELLKMNVFDISFPGDVEREMVSYKGKVPEEFVLEHRDIRKNGEIIWVKVSISTIKDDKGRSLCRMAIIENINNQKMAQEALETSELKYRTLFESMSEGLLKVDNNENILFVNDQFCRIAGYNKEELIGRNTRDILLRKEDYAIIEKKNFERKSGHSDKYEIQLKHKSGQLIWTEVSASPAIDIGGNINGSISLVTDITKRKCSEEQLRKLSSAVEQSLVSVLITDANGNIEYGNPQFTKTSGYLLQDVIGKNARILQSGQTNNETYHLLWSTIKSGNEWKGELLNKRKNGELYWEDTSISPIKNEKGEITHFLAIKEDITEKKRIDEQIRMSLKEKEIMLKEVHHRVKNNLQIISALLNLKRMNVENPEVISILEESRDRVQSMALVHKKLYSAGDFTWINLQSYIYDLSFMLLTNSNLKENVNIKYDIDEFNLDINTMVPLGLILNEMITNSFKHAFAGRGKGEILISAHKVNDGSFLLKYSDDGIGFSKDFIPEVSNSLGMQLIISLTDQINGILKIENSNGLHYEIKINEN
ncbi:MAG TPA: PAS domain S-box protein [Ignavibacteria bacterium]